MGYFALGFLLAIGMAEKKKKKTILKADVFLKGLQPMHSYGMEVLSPIAANKLTISQYTYSPTNTYSSKCPDPHYETPSTFPHP